MEILYSLMGAFCVMVSMCGLLTEKLKIWQYVCLSVYITLMGMWELKAEYSINVWMFLGFDVMLLLMVRKHKMKNLCLACFGYMFNIFFNNSILLAASLFFGISPSMIIRDHRMLFAVVYCIILMFTVKGVHFILYHKTRLFYNIEKTSYTVRYGLLINLFTYTVLFVVNMSWGEKTGYSDYAIQFNGFLFILCMLVSNYLIVVCTRHVRTEENRNAELKKQRLLEDYIACLEDMVEETRIFKHDYKNMLSTMAGFIHENRIEELQTYFVLQLKRPAYSKLDEMQAWQYLKNIQPMEIKGLLFEKVLLALSKGIRVQVEISENVNVEYEGLSDLLRILGIFMDNAVEEVEEKKGVICMIIAKMDSQILFQIMNECERKPDLSKIFCKGYSTKGEGRGLGLYSARSLLWAHEDIAHECRVEQGMFIQRLEIPLS